VALSRLRQLSDQGINLDAGARIVALQDELSAARTRIVELEDQLTESRKGHGVGVPPDGSEMSET